MGFSYRPPGGGGDGTLPDGITSLVIVDGPATLAFGDTFPSFFDASSSPLLVSLTGIGALTDVAGPWLTFNASGTSLDSPSVERALTMLAAAATAFNVDISGGPAEPVLDVPGTGEKLDVTCPAASELAAVDAGSYVDLPGTPGNAVLRAWFKVDGLTTQPAGASQYLEVAVGALDTAAAVATALLAALLAYGEYDDSTRTTATVNVRASRLGVGFYSPAQTGEFTVANYVAGTDGSSSKITAIVANGGTVTV